MAAPNTNNTNNNNNKYNGREKKLYYYWIWRVCPSCEVLGNLSLLLLLFSTLIGTHFLALSNRPLKQMDGTSIIYYLYVHFSFSRYNLFIALNSARISAFECMYKCVRMIKPNILSEQKFIYGIKKKNYSFHYGYLLVGMAWFCLGLSFFLLSLIMHPIELNK